MATLAFVSAALAYGPASSVLRSAPAAVRHCPVHMQEGDTLKCEVRKLPRSAIALDITVPAKVSNEIHLKTLNKLAKEAKVPGFRDGKVSPQVVLAKLGMQKVKEATVEQIVDVGMQQSGVGQRIHTVGEAELPETLEGLAKRYKIGEEVAFSLEVDVYPEVPLEGIEYKDFAVDVEKVPFNQEAYDKALAKLRKQYADITDAGEGVASEAGNQLVVNMNGFLATPSGEKGPELPAVAGGDGITVPLEPGKFMPGLVEGLVGVQAGQTRDITVTFPPRSSAPQLAGKTAIFEVECLKVEVRSEPACDDGFANRVKDGMTWTELDEKLREGVQNDAEEKLKANTHMAIEKALVVALPEEFEVPETMIENVAKERFAAMLADMRERGSSDEKLKELITPENYERYKKISRPQCVQGLKANFAIRAVGQQQGLSVSQSEVDDEVMTLQAQALQRGEKFKESEVRPKVEAQLEKTMVLSWLESQASVTLVEPKEFDPSEVLGATPEELAATMREEEMAKAAKEGNAAPAEAAAPAAPKAAPPPAASAPPAESASEAPTGQAPGGFEWGETF